MNIFLFFLINLSIYSQTLDVPKELWSVGGSYNFLSIDNNFTKLSETPNCCPQVYEVNNYNSFSINLHYNKLISDKFYWNLSLNFNYNKFDFQYTDFKDINVNGVMKAKINYLLTLDYNSIGTNLGFAYKIDDFFLNLYFNPNYLISKNYSQIEKVIEPEGYFVENPNNYDNINSTYLNEIYYNLGFLFNYHIALDNNKNRLSPFVAFEIQLANLHQKENFNFSQIKIGLSYTYFNYIQQSNPLMPKE